MKDKINLNKETILLHGGYDPETGFGAQAVPIVQTTSFRFKDSDHAASLFELNEFGNIYTRIMNPTTDVLEKRISELEGGVGAVAFASGMAAISAAIMTITRSGDEIIASQSLYGGTQNLFKYTLAKFGIKVHFIPINKLEKNVNLINRKTKAIFTESIGNPSLEITDMRKISEISHDHDIPLIVDNTVSPYIFHPFEHGADIITYSATKFIGGHGNSMGGLIVDSGNFNWNNGRFPVISDPDPEFHNLDFIEKFRGFGNIAYILKARLTMLRDFGGAISPFNSFLLIQGLETLHLRMKEHCKNALIIAKYLNNNPEIGWINYPGIGDSLNSQLANRYFPDGAGAIIGFGLKGGEKAGKKFIDSLKLISHLANIGDSKTLAIHPASTTHQRLSKEEQLEAGVTMDFIRLSIGIENPADIISDIDQSINKTSV